MNKLNIEEQIKEFEAKLNRKGYDGQFENWSSGKASFSEVIQSTMDLNSPIPNSGWLATWIVPPDQSTDGTLCFFNMQYDPNSGFDTKNLRVSNYGLNDGPIKSKLIEVQSFEELPSSTQASAMVDGKSIIPQHTAGHVSNLEKALAEKGIFVKFQHPVHDTLNDAIEHHQNYPSLPSLFPTTLVGSLDASMPGRTNDRFFQIEIDISATGKLLTREAKMIRQDSAGNQLFVQSLPLNDIKDLPDLETLQRMLEKEQQTTKANKKGFKI